MNYLAVTASYRIHFDVYVLSHWLQALIPDGEIIGRPALAIDGSVIVASARGTLNKVKAIITPN